MQYSLYGEQQFLIHGVCVTRSVSELNMMYWVVGTSEAYLASRRRLASTPLRFASLGTARHIGEYNVQFRRLRTGPHRLLTVIAPASIRFLVTLGIERAQPRERAVLMG
jgi:hypothetical protein